MGWSGDAMVLGKLLVPGRPTFWIIVGQGPIAFAVGAGGGCLDIFPQVAQWKVSIVAHTRHQCCIQELEFIILAVQKVMGNIKFRIYFLI